MAKADASAEAGGGAGHGDRFEFRVFRPRLGAAACVLAAVAAAGKVEASVDRYIVVPGRADAGLKLRGGRVELKTLAALHGPLECWHPQAAVGLPATGRDLLPLFRQLDLAGPPADAVLADVDALAEWAQAEAGLAVVELRKRRRRYLLVGVEAEIGDLRWNGNRLETLAVESTEPDRVAALVARLGLGGAANTSYPSLLSGVAAPDA